MTEAKQYLKKYFGYDSFLPKQEEIINSVLDKKDTVVLMPTGGGKSICFQIPALMLDGVCIVISPLISLMKDQVDSLKANGISSAFLNSSISQTEEVKIVSSCRNGTIKLLYLSPEKGLSIIDTFLSSLKISFIAIDEAHCISQWGHDFRPEYTQLKIFREKFSDVPLMALTATADKITRKDIVEQMCMRNPELFISSFDRPNLSLKVRAGLKEKQRFEEVLQFISSRKKEQGIIYCLSKKGTEHLSEKLRGYKINAESYHAGINSSDRNSVQERFINDETNIICATIAFGLGIDKSNVRWVIHYNLPKSIESYYQEIGRSGRDGLPSETILYYNLKDIILLSEFAKNSGQAKMNYEKLKWIQKYCEAKICRRKILINYFSESYTKDCGNCDVCKNPPKFFDGTVIAQKALSAIARLKEEVGTTMLIYVLRGSQNREVLEKGYDKIKTYGAGKEFSYEEWSAYILQLIQLGVMEVAYDQNYNLKITAFGKQILDGKVRIDLTNPVIQKEEQEEKVSQVEFSELQTKELFDELRVLRKQIATETQLPPYVIFHDKTLNEMAQRIPQTKPQMMLVSGVGENKFEKYGFRFMVFIKKYCSENSITPQLAIEELLIDEKIKEYADEYLKTGERLSHATLGKTLLGLERKFVSEKIKKLSFYSILKERTTYKFINPILKKYFRQNQKFTLQNDKAERFFVAPFCNHLKESSRESLKNAISKLPILRPDSEITNPYIIEQRKTFKRAYEHWSEKEEAIFMEAIKHTNDINFLSEMFQRNPGNLKSFYKKKIFFNSSTPSLP